MPHRIVLLDDHLVVLESFAYLLNTYEHFQVVGMAQNRLVLFDILNQRQVTNQPIDVLVTDLMLPDLNGVDLIRMVKARYPSLAIMVLSGTNDPILIRQAILAGADGFMTKTADKIEFFEALLAVANGRRYIDSRIFPLVEVTPTYENVLTEREMEIACLILEELTSTQIAERLFISFNTVETHRKRIYQKLGIKTSLGLMKYSLRLGHLKG